MAKKVIFHGYLAHLRPCTRSHQVARICCIPTSKETDSKHSTVHDNLSFDGASLDTMDGAFGALVSWHLILKKIDLYLFR
jgi:hypothetical protein